MKTQVNSKVTVIPKVEEESFNSTYRRVGIMGGTFNPPHIGHLAIAEQVYETLGLDAIHFMLTSEPGHTNGKTTINAEYRVDMLDYAIEDNPHFALDLTEVNRGGKTYTIDTIKQLQEANPNTDYFFIIGGDMVEDLPNWKAIEELVTLVKFVGVNRPGYKPETDYSIIWIDTLDIDLSSSDIRQRVKEGLSIKYLTPDPVIKYIEQKGLYLNEESENN